MKLFDHLSESVSDGADLVCIGTITSMHGIRGNVKIHTFTDKPQDIAAFDEIFDDYGKIYKITAISIPNNANCIIAQIDGFNSRNDAEALRNLRLYVKRSALPIIQNADEYYHADLCGMTARLKTGQVMGIVRHILNYGANDILEICDIDSEQIILYPFTKQFVHTVNIKERYMILEPLEEVV